MRNLNLLFWTCAVLMTAILSGCAPNADEQRRLFASEVTSHEKLVLAKMRVTKMATIDDIKPSEIRNIHDRAEYLLNKLKVGARKATYSYDTYVQAYVDLSDFTEEDVSIDMDRRRVVLNLPPVATEFAGRDAAVREEHYRVTGLRSQINAAERAELKELMNSVLKKELESDSRYADQLKVVARRKAVDYFTKVLSRDGWSVEVNIQ